MQAEKSGMTIIAHAPDGSSQFAKEVGMSGSDGVAMAGEMDHQYNEILLRIRMAACLQFHCLNATALTLDIDTDKSTLWH